MTPVSVVCCTYGRTQYLREVVESFRQQDYAGPMELMILNDAVEQELVCDVPNVRIFNAQARYETLGEKRNGVNALARHDYRINVDDDDVFLPWFVREMVAGLDAAVIDGEGFYLGSSCILVYGHRSSFRPHMWHHEHVGAPAYTAKLFDAVGGYPAMQSGQDKALLAKMRERFPSPKRPYRCRPAYLYRWTEDVRHFSDERSKGDEWNIARKLFLSSQEPRGRVEITPYWPLDYVRETAALTS